MRESDGRQIASSGPACESQSCEPPTHGAAQYPKTLLPQVVTPPHKRRRGTFPDGLTVTTAKQATNAGHHAHPRNVPALEMPLPFSARLKTMMRFRRWWRDIREDSPSFLTSLLFHMTIVILLGAAIPHRTRVADMGPLVVTFATGEQATETTLTMQASGDDEQKGDEQEAEEQSEPVASVPAAARQEVETPVKQSSPDASEDKVKQEPTVVITQTRFQVNGEDAFKRWLKEPTIFPAVESRKSDGDGRFSEHETEPQDDIGNRDDNVRPRDHDDIVNRFIRYDIGRLPGRAGQLAVHDFQKLGAAAIPALVRGLNKAAMIGASCPIVVISNKLDALLHQANDTRLTRYAVENMGRHLSHRAPHVRRVRLLRAKWSNRLPTEELALDQ